MLNTIIGQKSNVFFAFFQIVGWNCQCLKQPSLNVAPNVPYGQEQALNGKNK